MIVRLDGDGFTVEVSDGGMRVVAGRRPLLRTVAADAVPGIGLRHGGRWSAAGRVTASDGTNAFLACGDRAVRIAVRGDRITLASEGEPPDALGFVFALDGEWFGQGTFYEQRWPLNGTVKELDPFETTDAGWNVQCPAWLTSSGAALAVRGHAELSCDLRPATLALHTRGRPSLDLWLAAAPDVREAARALVRRLGAPGHRPPGDLFARPIWTTWAEYKRDIDQQVVLDYARRVVAEGFPRSVLEIDDIWQRAYGDLSFDERRFPDAGGMVDELHAMGFAVTCWVPWFVDETATLFAEGDAAGYFLTEPATGRTALISWWCNLERGGALIDCTKQAALDWWVAHLRALCESTGVDGFKFDAGEASWVPHRLRRSGLNVNLLSDRWAGLARLFGYAEARTGWMAQRYGFPMRQWDKFSTWGIDNGLAAVVPQALAMSLVGYPFVLPDMVGGNEYGNECTSELMVRWAQASAFLPIVQFSSAPWRWGEPATTLVRETTLWREEHANLFDTLADRAVADAEPMVRPVFWLAPHDERALRCGDAFLLGDDLLVAPVVTEDARSRDVYVPPGRWVDRNTGETHTGPSILESYSAPLEILPCFGREGSAYDSGLGTSGTAR